MLNSEQRKFQVRTSESYTHKKCRDTLCTEYLSEVDWEHFKWCTENTRKKIKAVQIEVYG